MIKLTRLTKKFASLTVVDNLTCQVKKGEIYGFIGPNGAGKTTTIKMMVGILPPTQGEIEISGFNLKTQPLQVKKIIGYIPDVPYLYPHLTGREFLYFVAHLYQVRNFKEKINKLLKLFPIQELIDGYFKDFSRGTKQKLVIIATLLHDPQVLIIDEPILGLDAQSSQVTKKVFQDFSKKGGTIFVSTHTLTVVEEICDRIGIIDQGKLIFTGTIAQLKKRLETKETKLEKLFVQIT